MGEKIRDRWGIQQRFAAVILLCVLVPMIAFSSWLLYSWKEQLIAQEKSQLQEQLNQTKVAVEQLEELCYLTGNAFQGNVRLMEHLDFLKKGGKASTAGLYDFYQNDIISLQRLVTANPYLYRVRVYSVCPQIDEMFPVLFGSQRLESIGWQGGPPAKSIWWLDYTDQMFGTNMPHLMALMQGMEGLDGTELATLEIAVEMQRVFPELFGDAPDAALLVEDGPTVGLATLTQAAKDLAMDLLAQEPQIVVTTLEDQPALVGAIQLEEINAVYCKTVDLTEIEGQTTRIQILLTVLMVLAGLTLGRAVRWLVHGMMRQLDHVLEGVRRFSQGDLEVEIPVESGDEIGRFSVQINQLLVSTRQLIRQNIQSEVLAKNTQIRALQSQINAHFLYNVLEAIKMMAEIDEEYEIADAVTNLAQLLRYTMKWNRRTVALREELEYIDHYLALVNLRYDGQISLERQVPEHLLEQAIPKLSLQPIVENAVVHGGSHREDRTIRLWAETLEDSVVAIHIHNDGEPMNAETLEHLRRRIEGAEEVQPSKGNGIGLRNVQERIRMTFGIPYGITINSSPERGTTVSVTVPCRPIDRGEGK